MFWSEIVFGSLLTVVLLVLSVYYGRHQVIALRRLRQTPNAPDLEQHYERRKAYRRLISCGLTLLLAALLGALMAYHLSEHRVVFDEDTKLPYTQEQTAFLRLWGGTWIAFLLVLAVVLFLAAVDLLSTRRYALRQFRKLQDDRRAMIERQAQRMRSDRNGEG